MISRHRRLEFGPRLCCANLVHAINLATAIPDEHLSLPIEGKARGDAQLSRKDDDFLQWSDAIDGPVEPAGNEHASSSIESDAGRIDNIAGELFNIVISTYSIERHRHVLAARTRFRNK